MSATFGNIEPCSVEKTRSLGLRDAVSKGQLACIVAMWMLCLVTFSLPGRESPEAMGGLDFIALAKLAVRVSCCFVFAVFVLYFPDSHRRNRVLRILFAFLLFLGWSILSSVWSPLKSVSLGQAAGLAALLGYAATVALVCQNPEGCKRIFWHLAAATFTFSAVVLAIHLVRSDLSGLDRSILLEGTNGMVHPTAAGATASLGLLLLVLTTPFFSDRKIRSFWPLCFLAFCLLVHGAVLTLAASRAAWLMVLATVPLALFKFSGPTKRGAALLGFVVLAMTVLLFDPGFQWLDEGSRSGAEYIQRGQSTKQLEAASGRVEMWTAVWQQFQDAKMIGHGYFVTSSNGKLNVWDGPANHSAHNLALQILVSTGIIGGLLFVLGMSRPLLSWWSLKKGNDFQQSVFWVLALVFLWFAGWSQGCISFMGPVRPESVIFFTMLGIGIGCSFPQKSLERSSLQ